MTSLDELVARVSTLLDDQGVPHRLIGAAALAAHGVARSTQDVDLLAVDPVVLDPSVWRDLPAPWSAEVLRGDDADPLHGVVRIESTDPPDDWETIPTSVDVVVPRGAWRSAVVDDTGPRIRYAHADLRAVSATDLVLLKLYAGGPRDGWDILSLLETLDDPAPVLAAVGGRLGALPESCRALWRRLTAQLGP